VTEHLPTRLKSFDAVLFDLDGVITPTADVHMRAWQAMFDELFAAWQISPAYTDDDYYAYVDGKKRYDGVAALLPTADTVCGVGNRKNGAFLAVLEGEGIDAYPGSLALVDALERAGTPIAIVSSSKNARPVLAAAGILDRFPVIVDGVTAETKHLPSKPAPDVFLEGARELGTDPARAVVVEDAIAGVESGARGGFGLVIGVDRGAGADALRAAGAHFIVNDLSELLEGPE
jgi:beta-phosphoglucomutase family hydrolase